MRITTNMMYDRNLTSLMKNSERLSKALDQMNTLEKFSTAGESPNGMAQKLNLTTAIEKYKQYASNGTDLQAKLTQEETTLDAVNTALGSAYTKVQQIVNGTNTDVDREALASELEELQKQLYDLMNARDENGEYLFAGNQSQTQPFTKDSNGNYIYQGDSGQRYSQISEQVKIASSDPGSSVFQQVATARSASSGTANLTVSVSDSSQFSSFYGQKYDAATSSNNTYSVVTTAGSPDSYEIRDAANNVLQSGEYVAGDAIDFNGLSLTVDVAAGGTTQTFSLDAPQNDNILNTLDDMISALRDPTASTEQINALAASTQTHISNTQTRVNSTLGNIGGRMNNLDSVLASNDSLSAIKKEAKANISELDMYDAITNVTKEDTALTMAQQAYSLVNKSTLFDYM